MTGGARMSPAELDRWVVGGLLGGATGSVAAVAITDAIKRILTVVGA